MIRVAKQDLQSRCRPTDGTACANRLLVVDDEPGIIRLIRKVAQEAGFEVACTTGATEFLDTYVEIDPGFIVMDLSMPGMDGVEILRFLATAKCSAKILIISGFDPRVLETTGRLGSAMGLQIAGTLSKPMRVAELRKVIADLAENAAA